MERDYPNLDRRKSGGAGIKTQPLSDEEHRQRLRKLEALNAADAENSD
jgi:hypothetical protein